MVITCPTCHKRYYVDSADIKEARPVRCGACSSVWVAEQGEHNELPILDLGDTRPPKKKGFARKLRSHKDSSMRSHTKVLKNRTLSTILFLALPTTLFLMFFTDSATKNSYLLGFQNLVLTIKNTILEPVTTPKAKPIHMRGLKVRLNKDTKHFTIVGTLQNTSPETVALTPLRIKLLANNKDSKKKSLMVREALTHTLPKTSLQAGASIAFSYTLPKVVPWLRGVSVSF